ncbi:MAG: flippase-like domain-containing protein [Bacteroidota bacterium]|nr:flippase-like domain-containing protein [Bacteroidota bacterium]
MPRIIFEGFCKEELFLPFMRLNKNIKNFVNYFLGPVLFVWLSYSIYKQIIHQPNLKLSWQHIKESINSPLLLNLFEVMFLMLVNWSLEALKWKLSIQKIQPISFSKAFKAILSGVSFSVSTPNRMGEYVGRVLYMKEGNRLRAISLTIVGSMSQLIITLAMGSIGLIFLMNKIESGEIISALWVRVLISGVIMALLILTVFYFRLSWLVKWMDRLPGTRRHVYLVKAIEDFNATLLWKLLSLSAIRFVVFGIQYYLLFRLFGVEISRLNSFWVISVIFLILAIIPTIALADLGLRGKVSLKLIGLFSVNDLGIGFSTVSIWFINLVIPAIVGSLLILSIKIFKNKNEGL